MWVNKRDWEQMRDAVTKYEAVNRLLDQHNTTLTASLDWMRVRLTQLEHERALLVHNYMGIKLPVPSIERTDPIQGHPLNQSISFNDVGDAEASKLGLSWDEQGNLIRTK